MNLPLKQQQVVQNSRRVQTCTPYSKQARELNLCDCLLCIWLIPNTMQVSGLVKKVKTSCRIIKAQRVKELSIKPSFLSFSSSQQYHPISHMVVLHQSEKQQKCLENTITFPSITHRNLCNETSVHELHTMSRSHISIDGSSIKPTAMKFPANI